MPNRHSTPRAAGIAAFSVLLLAASVAFGQTYIGTTSNDFGPQMIANSPTDTGILVEADATGKLLVSTTPAAGTTTAVNLTQVLGAAHSATNPVFVEVSTALSARIPAALVGGRFSVDVGASALPSGAATEATLATLATQATAATLGTEATLATRASEATIATLGTEVTLGTRASEATVATLATQATVATLGTEATLATRASEATVATLATQATLAAVSAQIPASVGAKTGAASLSVVPSTDTPFPVTDNGGALTVDGSVTATVASTTLTATVLPAAATHETSALAFQVGIAATLMGTATAGRKSLQIHNPGGSGRSIYCGISAAVTATNANSIWEVEPGQNWAEPFPTATTVYCIAALATYASWTGIF